MMAGGAFLALEVILGASPLNLSFVIAYLVIGLTLLAVELVGIVRPQRGDTVSETWWWIQKRYPILARIAYLAGAIWLSIHLLVR